MQKETSSTPVQEKGHNKAKDCHDATPHEAARGWVTCCQVLKFGSCPIQHIQGATYQLTDRGEGPQRWHHFFWPPHTLLLKVVEAFLA